MKSIKTRYARKRSRFGRLLFQSLCDAHGTENKDHNSKELGTRAVIVTSVYNKKCS